MIATVVDTTALLKMVYSSLIAAIGVSVIFSLAVLGGSRFADRRREAKGGEAAAYATLAVIAALASLGLVIYGIVLVTHK